jgi:hypothetical protein
MASKAQFTIRTGEATPWRHLLEEMLYEISGKSIGEQADELDGLIEHVALSFLPKAAV